MKNEQKLAKNRIESWIMKNLNFWISYLPPRRLLALFALLPILLLPPRVGRFTNIDILTWMISPYSLQLFCASCSVRFSMPTVDVDGDDEFRWRSLFKDKNAKCTHKVIKIILILFTILNPRQSHEYYKQQTLV